MKNNNVPICAVLDNGYAMPTAVMLSSLKFTKSKNTKYKIYLVCNLVNSDTKKKINLLASDDFSIKYIDVEEKIPELENFKINNIPATPTSIYKFFIPELIGNEKKIIYLDGDVIVKQDLSELYKINLENNFIAAVKDLNGLGYLKLSNEKYTYFNSGVMLMNLAKMRDENISEKLMQYRINGLNKLMDQDALNYVFKDKVKMLHFKYNTQMNVLMANLYDKRNYSISKIKKYWSIVGKVQTVDDIIKDAVILHYTSLKPWKYFDCIGNEIWLKYYYLSPYKDIDLILESKYIKHVMNMKAYRLGNFFLSPFRLLFPYAKKLVKTKYKRFLLTFKKDGG